MPVKSKTGRPRGRPRKVVEPAPPKPASDPNTSSIAKFAQRVRRSAKSVTGMIDRGDIPADCVAEDAFGRRFICDVARAEAAARAMDTKTIQGRGAREPPKFDASVNLEDPSTWPKDPTLLKAIREHHAAKQTMLKTSVLAGGYVRIDEMRLEVFGLLRILRDRVQTLPEAIKADLAAEFGIDAERAREMLTMKIEAWLEELAAALEAKCSTSTVDVGGEEADGT